MSDSMSVVTESLFKLRNELQTNGNNKNKKFKLTLDDELLQAQSTDDLYRKRKIPNLSTRMDEESS
jgi:hypothetical protein